MRFIKKRLSFLIVSCSLVIVVIMPVWGWIRYGSPFFQDFLSNLSSTILGIMIGIPVALWINGLIEARTEKERKKKILGVLLDESQENSSFLEFWKSNHYDFSKVHLVRQGILSLCVSLYTESWDAFSNGGELEWINDPTLLNILATSYNKVCGIKYLANRYLDFAYSNNKVTDQETLEFIGKNLKEKVNSALTHLAAAEEYIEVVSKVY